MPLFKRNPDHIEIKNAASRLQSATDAGQVIGKFGVAHDPRTGALVKHLDGALHEVVGHAEQVGGMWRITDARTGIVHTVAGDGTPISRKAGQHEQRSRGWRGG